MFNHCFVDYNWEGIIVPLDRRFVVYPGAAGVGEGAGVDEDAGVDKGAGVVCPGSCDVLIARRRYWPG